MYADFTDPESDKTIGVRSTISSSADCATFPSGYELENSTYFVK